MRQYRFTAQVVKDNETGLYVGIIPNLPGAHTQGATLDELYSNLQEVVELCIGEMSEDDLKNLPDVIGFQQISIAI
ncbi:MAG: type II toxin-antitoxin system HicB family antitoxin [Bacteroidetes bacterium]|nr:type II toxin-antitoxin system HicB family antitoxin [Bacteroidota bacterium]